MTSFICFQHNLKLTCQKQKQHFFMFFQFRFFVAFSMGSLSVIPFYSAIDNQFILQKASAPPSDVAINSNPDGIVDASTAFDNTDAEGTVLRQGLISSYQSGHNDTS
jgi:hypothetical protein